MAMGGIWAGPANAQCGDNGDGTFSNPVFWADVPDPDVIRVGDDFYMVSTTMHLVPGAPIMHSKDLVNWEIVSYLYDRLDDKPNYDLKEGTVYGRGQWATSLRYHDGMYYAYFSPNDTPYKGYVYTTSDPKRDGPCCREFLTFMTHRCFSMMTEKRISFMEPDSCVS